MQKHSVRETLSGKKAKEAQCAFKSPLDCSLQIDAKFLQINIFLMYRSGDFMGSNSFKRLSFEMCTKSFKYFNRPQDSEMAEVERPLKRDMFFPNKDQGSVPRSMVSANHWFRSIETYAFLW